MEEGRVLACGEAIEGLCYEDAMRWCQRGWQAWRPDWPVGYYLFAEQDGTIRVASRSADLPGWWECFPAGDTYEKGGFADWIVRVVRHDGPGSFPFQARPVDMMPDSSKGTSPACVVVPWHHKDMEIRLQIAVHEIVQRALADGLAASGALRSVEHELARIAEQAEASENMAG